MVVVRGQRLWSGVRRQLSSLPLQVLHLLHHHDNSVKGTVSADNASTWVATKNLRFHHFLFFWGFTFWQWAVPYKKLAVHIVTFRMLIWWKPLDRQQRISTVSTYKHSNCDLDFKYLGCCQPVQCNSWIQAVTRQTGKWWMLRKCKWLISCIGLCETSKKDLEVRQSSAVCTDLWNYESFKHRWVTIRNENLVQGSIALKAWMRVYKSLSSISGTIHSLLWLFSLLT